ncbi:MAG: signal peptidase I [Abditibacteriaceae bacterium]
MSLNMDSWFWRIAIVLAIVVVREFVRYLFPPDSHPSADSGEGSKWIIEMLDSAAIAIGLVLFIIQPFILQAFFIPSGSMENTLLVGDRLLVSKLDYRLKDPSFQDVVVFKAPEVALGGDTPEGSDFIKRCIGTPGDIVYVVNRQVYREPKGQTTFYKVNEPYTKWKAELGLSVAYDMKIVNGMVYSREYADSDGPGPWRLDGVPLSESEQAYITNAKPGDVPPGKFLMLGDHRNNSNDGHVWGFVPRANVIGKAIVIFWPPTRLRLIDVESHTPTTETPVQAPSFSSINFSLNRH